MHFDLHLLKFPPVTPNKMYWTSLWEKISSLIIKMNFKRSALTVVGNVHVKLAESVEKKNSQMLCVCSQEN